MKKFLLFCLVSFLGVVQWAFSLLPSQHVVTSRPIAASAPEARVQNIEKKIPATAEIPTPKQTLKTIPVEPPPPTPQLPQSNEVPSYSAQLEAEIFRLTNTERATVGLPPLTLDARLSEIARVHSADMLANNFFSHEDKSGCGSSCRANTAGYAWSTIGENIYMTQGYTLTAPQMAALVVEGWMNSSGHRENILRLAYTNAGVGIAIEGEDIYTTAMYAKPL